MAATRVESMDCLNEKELKGSGISNFWCSDLSIFKRITDHSMHPILRKGDFIIISPFVDMLELGDLVLIRDPLDQRSHLLRRIDRNRTRKNSYQFKWNSIRRWRYDRTKGTRS